MMEVIDWKSLTPEQRDAHIAEKVMGLHVVYWPPHSYPEYNLRSGYVLPDEFGSPYVLRYTQDMNAAWSVLKKMKEQLFSHRMNYLKLLQECVTRRHSELDGLIAWPDVLWFLDAEDICIAALRSFGMEVQA